MDSKNIKNITSEFGSIDIKSFLLKVLSYWKLFIVSILVALAIAKYKNMMGTQKYSINTLITINEDSNPMLSSNTNISFNWGGASDMVESVKAKIKSRTHNEKVVEKLEFYINYLEKKEILFKTKFKDIYGYTPFIINVNATKGDQIQNNKIELLFLTSNKVQITLDLGKEKRNFSTYNYFTHSSNHLTLDNSYYQAIFDLNKTIKTPFCEFDLHLISKPILNKTYYISFSSFNGTVAHYKSIKVKSAVTGTSLLKLSMDGGNKKRLIKYLNETISVLKEEERSAKINYAVKTKTFIDSLFNIETRKLSNIEEQLVKFKTDNSVKLSNEGTRAYNDIFESENLEQELKENVQLLLRFKNNTLENDLDIKNIPLTEIKDLGLQTAMSELINLLILKDKLSNNHIYPSHPDFIELNSKIDFSKNNIKNRINSLIVFNSEKSKKIRNHIQEIKSSIKNLPLKEHQLIQLEKEYALSESNYNILKQKSYDAGAAIAANSSSIKTIDNAKDIGQGPLATKSSFNYVVAVLLGIILPLIFITFIEALNDRVYTVQQLENVYTIPVLGVVGKNQSKENLVLVDTPNSSISESFRSIRSNIPYLFKKDNISENNKTILCTSSIGGEGKTFVSMNIASSYALSGKKTILLGFDLRKPKIHREFNLENKDVGLVNYIIGDLNLNEVIQPTEIPNLDIILTGTIPPNPSELILSSATKELFTELKKVYDYIIIDTPPVGLVSDALDLMEYSDANIYVTRQSYSKRGMMKMIDQKYKNGEVENIAFILNDFEQSTRYGYDYGYGYGYGSYGYHSDEKSTTRESITNFFGNKKTS